MKSPKSKGAICLSLCEKWYSEEEFCLRLRNTRREKLRLAGQPELAGLPVGQTMTILTEFGVESRVEKEAHLEGLGNLRGTW
jgi:hypothetical protein